MSNAVPAPQNTQPQNNAQLQNAVRPRSAASMAGPNLFRVLKAELIKFRTVPSTPILLGVTLVVMVGLSVFVTWTMVAFSDAFDSSPSMPQDVVYFLPTAGVSFGILIFVALGAVFVASEMSTGAIRSTVLSAPHRWMSIVAKAMIVALAGFVVTVIASLISYFLDQLILMTKDMNFSLGADHVLTSMLWAGLYVALAGILAVAVGTLLRNTAGSIVILVALWFVVPIIFNMISGVDWTQRVSYFLPMSLGTEMYSTQAGALGDGAPNQWQAFLAMLVWALVPLVAALWVNAKRDVK